MATDAPRSAAATTAAPAPARARTTNRFVPGEVPALLVLAAVQCVSIVDLVLVAPLERPLARAMHRGTGWFAASILAFTVASCGAALAGAPLLDRLARRRLVVALAALFALGEALSACALGPASYVAARVLAGAAAGLLGGAANAMISDVCPPERHGAASGLVNAAYPVAFLAGVPLAALLAGAVSWRAPFALLAALAGLVALAGAAWLPRATRAPGRVAMGGAAPEYDRGRAVRIAALNALVLFSAYTVTPFVATHLVLNVRVAERLVPHFYFVGGLCTLLVVPLVGALVDRRGPALALGACVLASLAPTFDLCALGPTSVARAMLATTLFMATVTARTVPALALALDAVPEARRGAYLSRVGALQQLALGLGAALAGALVTERATGLDGMLPCALASALSALVCLPLLRGQRWRR